jgi:hypothetical protein
MKINIIWGKYVVYDYGREDISTAIGEKSIDIKDSTGTVVSKLKIDTTNNQILKLPTLSRDVSYDIEIDDGILDVQSDLPSEDEEPEQDGIKISELPATSALQQSDLFAISRDDAEDGSYNRTLHVTLTDLIASINPLATYILTVNGVTGGAVTPLAPENYQEGATVTAGITMEPEYNFLSWTSDWPTLDGSTDASLNFQMPAQDVTLTPNVEVADNSTWDHTINEAGALGLGWPGYDPPALRYSNETTKTSDSNDFKFFYHNNSTFTYTSILVLDNEFDWVKTEIQSNPSNLLVEYIDNTGTVLQDSSLQDLSYTGLGIETKWFGASSNNIQTGGIRVLGISDDTGGGFPGQVYLGMQYDLPYPHVQARITKIDTNDTLTSPKLIVYDRNDPTFGVGV